MEFFKDVNHGVSGEQLVKLIKYDYANSNLLGTDGDYKSAVTPPSNYYKGNLTSINTYYWNYNASGSSNTWSTGLLNKINLNTNFITNIGEEWANKISMTTWKVGGNVSANIVSVSSSSIYQNEIINPVTTKTTDNKTTYNAKIGLMYVSDYGFAAGSDAWTLNMDSYNNTIAANNNWMFMGNSEWTITRFADVSTDAINIQATGAVNALVLLVSRGVRVVFNLEPSLIYKSGMGSINDPIIIE